MIFVFIGNRGFCLPRPPCNRIGIAWFISVSLDWTSGSWTGYMRSLGPVPRRVSRPVIPRRMAHARGRYAERSSASHGSQAPDTSTTTRSLRWCLRQYLSSPSALKLSPKLAGGLVLSVQGIDRLILAAVEREHPRRKPQWSDVRVPPFLEPSRATLDEARKPKIDHFLRG